MKSVQKKVFEHYGRDLQTEIEINQFCIPCCNKLETKQRFHLSKIIIKQIPKKMDENYIKIHTDTKVGLIKQSEKHKCT